MSQNQSSAVSFNYLVNNRYNEGSKLPVRMQGLNSEKKYRLTEINLYPGTESTIKPNTIYSGDFLMKVGFNPNLKSERTSVVIKIEEVKP
ncbi:GH36 C-terminal domain-containing protein [Pedobacter frigidisoli]|uniref:GH36 C-terminal domain-containing protein n=1 Tax=Pedobacter frigidisoli TaxID=2530455 RepID=UPI0021CEC26C|nr:GH36 C-terminal domain-containing protein [Pedobacter frigidisoli]